MYQSFNKHTKDLVNYIFIECACWSVIDEVRWVLISNVSTAISESELKTIYDNVGVVFTFFIFDDAKPFILVGIKKDYTKITEVLNNLNYNCLTCDWSEIIELLCKNNWEDLDFNKTLLFWDPVYQQTISELIDSLSGGWVADLPKSWVCIPKNPNWRVDLNTKHKAVEKNDVKFFAWKKEAIKTNPNAGFCLEFVYWMEKNYD